MKLLSILLVVAVVLVTLYILRKRCASEKYAGQTFGSRAGGIAGPAPNWPNYTIPPEQCFGCGPPSLLVGHPEDGEGMPLQEMFEYASGEVHAPSASDASAPVGCPFGGPQSCPYGQGACFGCPYGCKAGEYMPPTTRSHESCCGR